MCKNIENLYRDRIRGLPLQVERSIAEFAISVSQINLGFV